MTTGLSYRELKPEKNVTKIPVLIKLFFNGSHRSTFVRRHFDTFFGSRFRARSRNFFPVCLKAKPNFPAVKKRDIRRISASDVGKKKKLSSSIFFYLLSVSVEIERSVFDSKISFFAEIKRFFFLARSNLPDISFSRGRDANP